MRSTSSWRIGESFLSLEIVFLNWKTNDWIPRRDWRRCLEIWKQSINRKSTKSYRNWTKANKMFDLPSWSTSSFSNVSSLGFENARDVSIELTPGRRTSSIETRRVWTSQTRMGRRVHSKWICGSDWIVNVSILSFRFVWERRVFSF